MATNNPNHPDGYPAVRTPPSCILLSMRFPHLAAAFLLTTAATFTTQAQTPNTLTPKEAAAGFHLLFDGKSPTGWRSTHTPAFPTIGWTIHDGLLSVHEQGGEEGGNAGDIITTRKYANFELLVDFRLTTGANSGIKYFVALDNSPTGGPVGFEYQLLDDAVHPDAKKGHDGDRTLASLYDLIPAAASKPTRPIGQWNTARILVRGTHGEHWLNGVKVLEYDRLTSAFRQLVAESKFKTHPHFGELSDGYILLQDHGFPVDFRNIRIRELPPVR